MTTISAKSSDKKAFLISKPLQLLVALCIAQEKKFIDRADFIIIDAFAKSKQVADSLSTNFQTMQKPVYFSTRGAALNHICKNRYSTLFVDCDVGLKNFIIFRLLKIINPELSVNVYEEGLGTYRFNLYYGFKKICMDFFGVGVYFGSSSNVDNIYVYQVDEYIACVPKNGHKAKQISTVLSDFLHKNLSELMRVFKFSGFETSPSDISCCSVYLSSWELDKRFLKNFGTFAGDLFCKPHPHIKEIPKLNSNVRLIDASVPAELLIAGLLSSYETVTIYHHGTSAQRYIKSKRVNFIEIMNVE